MAEKNGKELGRGSAELERSSAYAPASDLTMWIHEQIQRGGVSIVMRQRAEEGEVLVTSWPLPGSGAQATAAAIEMEAHTEGQVLRGPTLFVLYAMKEGREHMARRTIRIAGNAFPVPGETEPATQSGIVSMLMRHADAATKIALGHTANIIEQYETLLGTSQQRIQQLEEAHLKSAELRDSLMGMQQQHDLALQKAKVEARQSEVVFENVFTILPSILSHLLGTKGGPPALADQIVRQFLGSLQPDQLAAVTALLTPEQQMIITDLYMRFAAQSTNPEVVAAVRGDASPGVNGTHTDPKKRPS